MKRKREKNCYLKTVCDGVRSYGRGKGHASEADGTEDCQCSVVAAAGWDGADSGSVVAARSCNGE
jgi:hypothetical protein